MSNDGGMISKVEDWLAATLKALTLDGDKVFKTAEFWAHQVSLSGSGVESAERYAPFAFPAYAGVGHRNEGGDLMQAFRMSVLIGQVSEKAGQARRGSSSALGTSKLRELVIAAIHNAHPADGLTCDYFRCIDEVEIVDLPKVHIIEIVFESNWFM